MGNNGVSLGVVISTIVVKPSTTNEAAAIVTSLNTPVTLEVTIVMDWSKRKRKGDCLCSRTGEMHGVDGSRLTGVMLALEGVENKYDVLEAILWHLKMVMVILRALGMAA